MAAREERQTYMRVMIPHSHEADIEAPQRLFPDEIREKDLQGDIGVTFVPTVIKFIRENVRCATLWDDAIYLNTKGLAVIPPAVFLVQLPVVFFFTLSLGWLIAPYCCWKQLNKHGFVCDMRFWWDFGSMFFGCAAPCINLMLKLALYVWGEGDRVQDLEGLWQREDLLGLWREYKLSAIELLAPFLMPVAVAAAISYYFYEFAVTKATIYCIGDELDEHGVFRETMEDLGDFFSIMRDKITDRDGKLIKRFAQVPFTDHPNLDFQLNGDSYAESWATRQIAEQHVANVIKVPRKVKVIIYVLALVPAATPFAWMRWTHPDDYLSSSLISVKYVATCSFLCLLFLSRYLLFGAWRNWEDFVTTRTHLLCLLFVCANDTGRRYVYRLWRDDLRRLTICSEDLHDMIRTNTDEAAKKHSLRSNSVALLGGRSRTRINTVCADSIIENMVSNSFRDLAYKCREKPFTSNQSENIELDQLLREQGLEQFRILNVEKFANLRACLKPNLMVARVRLEATLLGSSFIALSCGFTVLVDFESPPYGICSCVGAMAAEIFLICSVCAIGCVHTAVMMNMAVLDSSQEVLLHWESIVETASLWSKRLDHFQLKGTFSENRVQLQSKFDALQKAFEKRIRMFQQEKPLTFAFVPTTPAWRNRLIVALLVTTLGTTGHWLWLKVLEDTQAAQRNFFQGQRE